MFVYIYLSIKSSLSIGVPFVALKNINRHGSIP